MSDSYSKLGASASKQGLHDALGRSGLLANSGLFASIWPDFAGDSNFCSFLHCDGAGTKSIVAYLLFRETGDSSVFAGLAQDALVMNLDDMFCLGQPTSMLLSNMIARSANRISDDILEVLLKSYAELQKNFAALGIPFTLSGGETADCGDVVRTLLVDAVLAGRLDRRKLIDTSNIQVGDAIIGLSSCGKANYETKPNSGIGSNGLTLARHALLRKEYSEKYPEVVDPGVDQSACYRGKYGVLDAPNGLEMTVGEALLSPTRSYAPLLARIYEDHFSALHAAIHVTGGGQTKVLRFSSGKRFIKDNLFPTPPIFKLIQESGNIPAKEMFQVFNMGHRFELYVQNGAADDIIRLSKSFGIDAKRIGSVEKSSDAKQNEVIIKCAAGEFEYKLEH